MRKLLTTFSLVALLGSACAAPELIQKAPVPMEVEPPKPAKNFYDPRDRALEILATSKEGPAKEIAEWVVNNGGRVKDPDDYDWGYRFKFESCPRASEGWLDSDYFESYDVSVGFSADGVLPYIEIFFEDFESGWPAKRFTDFGVKSSIVPSLGDSFSVVEDEPWEPGINLLACNPNDEEYCFSSAAAQSIYEMHLGRVLDTLTVRG